MKRLSLLLLIVTVLLALGSAAIARAGSSANYAALREPNTVVAGAQTAASANYTISSTAGQLATGQGTSANYSVCSGLWCQAQAALAQLFLPLVRR
jgi:hypothetical protein